MKFIQQNLIFFIVALIIIAVFIGILTFVNQNTSEVIFLNEGQLLGEYQRRHQTAAGNFLVSYSYPQDWIIKDNELISNDSYLDNGSISIYYVFEEYSSNYSNLPEKKFEDRIMYWSEYVEDMNESEVKVIDVYWPIESINSSVRFTCIGPKSSTKTKNDCEQFILSFRLD